MRMRSVFVSQAALFERDGAYTAEFNRRAPPLFNPAVLHQTIRPATASVVKDVYRQGKVKKNREALFVGLLKRQVM
jgi:hypothetical protein